MLNLLPVTATKVLMLSTPLLVGVVAPLSLVHDRLMMTSQVLAYAAVLVGLPATRARTSSEARARPSALTR